MLRHSNVLHITFLDECEAGKEQSKLFIAESKTREAMKELAPKVQIALGNSKRKQ